MSATPASEVRRSSPPALGEERAVAWPPRTVRTLDCGLQIVLAEAPAFPKITAELIFRSGNAVVAQSAPGLAEMAAAVVRTGTISRGSRNIEEELRRMGADLSAGAGADSSTLSISGLAEFSAGLLALVSDLARNATFPAEEFERERRQRLEELKIERKTPGFLASERLRRLLFGSHPYAIAAPTEEQVAAYRRELLCEFYRRNYVPSNALLIVVGDFNSAQMLEQIGRAFESWERGSASSLCDAALPEIQGRQVHLVHMPGAVQTDILVGNRAITRTHPDWHRLALANSIFGGAFHSRLVANLREQKGYTYSPRSAVHPLRQHGFFSIHVAVRHDVVAAALAEIFYELDCMRARTVDEEELADAKSYMCGVYSLSVATQEGLLNQLSTVYLNALPEDYLETYRDRVSGLTADDVLVAARRYFDSANAQIVLVGDPAQIAEHAALFGPVQAWDAQGNRI